MTVVIEFWIRERPLRTARLHGTNGDENSNELGRDGYDSHGWVGYNPGTPAIRGGGARLPPPYVAVANGGARSGPGFSIAG